MAKQSTSSEHPWHSAMGVMLIVIVVFASTWMFYRTALDDYFYFDDFVFLERSTLNTPADLLKAFSVEANKKGLSDKNHSYRPVSTNIYFGVTHAIFGASPLSFHWINLLTLQANALLLYLLLRRLKICLSISLLMAIIYALSPVQTESQLWISVFQELSVTFFLLIALLVYIEPRYSRKTATVLSCCIYILAMLCKEMAITLPALLICWELLVARKSFRSAILSTAPLWILSVVVAVARFWFIPIPTEGPYAVTLGRGILDNLAQYLSWTSSSIFLISDLWVGVMVVVVSVTAAVLRFLTSNELRVMALGTLWFLISLGPVIFMSNHIFDFYLIIPIIGAIIVVAALSSALINRMPHIKVGIGVCMLLALGYTLGSYRNFSDRADSRGRVTDVNERIISEIRTLYPEFPEQTTLHFNFPRGYPARSFLKGEGACLRFVYQNPTLRCRIFTPSTRLIFRREPLKKHHAFSIREDGSVSEVIFDR